MNKSMLFTEQYYNSNNYAGYLERGERYQRQVEELHHELLQKVCIDFREGKVLDYGCAVGFVVKALMGLGYHNVTGYDVSQWAVDYGHKILKIPHGTLTTCLQNVLQQQWNITFAFDVLEHIPLAQLQLLLTKLNTQYILVRAPLAVNDGGNYVLNVSERDVTHIVRLTRESWHRLFGICNYDWLFNVNLASFYDSSGVMCAMLRKRL